MVFAVNKNNVVVDVDPTISSSRKLKAKKQKEKYDRYVENHPEAVTELLDSFNSSDYVCAISYTEAPLVYVEDHYERVEKKNNITSSYFSITANAEDRKITSDPSLKHRFTLQTTILRRGVGPAYSYQATTSGTWDNSVSVTGGETKPAGGDDYILQACPTITSSVIFNSTYNHETSGSKNGQEGKNYFKTDGRDSWVRIGIVDDPVGLAQLSTFRLTQTFKAQSTSETKKINSYYVHTWKQMSVSVSVSGNAGVTGGKPSAGVSLGLSPSIVDKQWQVYNFVTYNW